MGKWETNILYNRDELAMVAIHQRDKPKLYDAYTIKPLELSRSTNGVYQHSKWHSEGDILNCQHLF